MFSLTATDATSERRLPTLPTDGMMIHVVAFAAALIPTIALGWVFFAR